MLLTSTAAAASFTTTTMSQNLRCFASVLPTKHGRFQESVELPGMACRQERNTQSLLGSDSPTDVGVPHSKARNPVPD